MALTLTGKSLTIEDIEAVARRGEKVELHVDARERISVCRSFIEERIAAGEIMYGVNTGIGEFSEVVLSEDQVRDFQRYLSPYLSITSEPPCCCERTCMRTAVRAAGLRSLRRL
jgi:histidine ammonia-lyase